MVYIESMCHLGALSSEQHLVNSSFDAVPTEIWINRSEILKKLCSFFQSLGLL